MIQKEELHKHLCNTVNVILDHFVDNKPFIDLTIKKDMLLFIHNRKKINITLRNHGYDFFSIMIFDDIKIHDPSSINHLYDALQKRKLLETFIDALDDTYLKFL